MFSRIQTRPVSFTGPLHNFGDQTSPQNLVGAPDLSRKDEFRRDLNRVVQTTTQPPDIEQAPSLIHRKEKAPMNGPPMSYTGGWANPMNPTLGGAPIPHSDMGLESPSFQNRRVLANQGHQPYFRGVDQQGKPAFMATIADYPSIMSPKRVDRPHTNFQPPKTAAKSKIQAMKTHYTSASPFALNLPYSKSLNVG